MPGHGTCVIHTDNDNISRVMVPTMNSLPLSTKFALTPGVCWDIGASEHHVHFAYGTATGWVRGNNTYHERVKSVVSWIVYYISVYSWLPFY